MKNYEWKSDFSTLIKSFLDQNRLAGRKFSKQEHILQQFDHFYFYNGYKGNVLTKYVLNEFIYGDGVQQSTHYCREVVFQQFADFLNGRGYKAYRIEEKTKLPRCKYIPHIYTKEEKQRFFKAVDTYPQAANSFRNTVDPMLFRFLCCTGVRLSEALNLTIGDYNEQEGTVFIRQTKNNRDRLLPLAAKLNRRLKKYVDTFLCGKSSDTYIFPSYSYKRMDNSTAYRHFRDYLLMADIPHTGSGPRIHDFRHGVAVENLRKWSFSGENLTNRLPYLSAYMGHSDFRATQYYLRLTAEIYPEMMAVLEDACLDIIPEGGFYK